MSSSNSRLNGIKVFQIGDSTTSARLLGIKLMLNFKNIVASMSTGLKDDHLGAMASFIPPRLHSKFQLVVSLTSAS